MNQSSCFGSRQGDFTAMSSEGNKIRVGIIGAGGYAGETLLQILLRHPGAKINWLMSEDAHKGKNIADLYPHLAGEIDMVCQTLQNLAALLPAVDLVFLALPHGIALNYVPKMIDAGKKVIDLGADYRFCDNEVFGKWYGIKHPTEKYLKEAVFGLPELYRDNIKNAALVANPGCYPTASILGVAPLLRHGLIDANTIIIDAKSGITGAGRGVTFKTHFCERNEGIEAYAAASHRHMGEIEFQLSRAAGKQLRVTFVPHLSPMNRGILATCYAKINNPSFESTASSLTKLYKEFYKDEPFVKVFEGKLPNTKFVAGTNYCNIAVELNSATGTVIVISVIDNLIKGAAGQAVQNMNLLYGFEETTALRQMAVYP